MPGEGDTSSKGFAMKLGAGAKKPKVAAAASAIGAADAPDAGPVREQIGEVVDGHVGEKKAAPTITPLANTLLVGGGGRKLGEEAPPAIAEPAPPHLRPPHLLHPRRRRRRSTRTRRRRS